MKLTLIGNGFMAQALAKGLIENFEVEIIGRDINKLNKIKEMIPKIEVKTLDDIENIDNKNILLCKTICSTKCCS